MPKQFFRLCDLWKCYDEWSAYGADVPVQVNGGKERVVQYFVPYLSALQIYTTSPHRDLIPDPLTRSLSLSYIYAYVLGRGFEPHDSVTVSVKSMCCGCERTTSFLVDHL